MGGPFCPMGGPFCPLLPAFFCLSYGWPLSPLFPPTIGGPFFRSGQRSKIRFRFSSAMGLRASKNNLGLPTQALRSSALLIPPAGIAAASVPDSPRSTGMSNFFSQSFTNWFGSLRRRSTMPTVGFHYAVRIPRFESLERRDLMTAVNMSPYDQLLLELINRARANPGAEASRYGIDLNAGLASGTISYDAKQPVAPNQMLQIAAGGHSEDMLANNYFSHTNLAGQSPSDRAAAAGYPTWVGENISWGGTTGSVDQIQHVYQRHQRLFESSGHRRNMMNPNYEEIGVGVRFGQYTYSSGVTYNASMVTENFGNPGIDPVITGVVYTDAADGSSNDDDFYSVGEQVSSGLITVTNVNTGATFTTEIGTSGGFSLPVDAGTYHVVATSGIDGAKYLVANVVISNENVKVDFETTTATTANSAPMLEQMDDITLFLGQTNVNLTLEATDEDGDILSFSVTVENFAAHLDKSLGLTTTSSVNENWGGRGEKWLAGDGDELYYVTPSGQLFRWTGGGPGNISGTLIASLDTSFHQNVELLHAAALGLNGATANVIGDELSIVTDTQYDGTFVVTITVSDGLEASETSFRVAKGNQFGAVWIRTLACIPMAIFARIGVGVKKNGSWARTASNTS